MPFDGGFTYKMTEELSEAVDCHIDKIYQPSRDELVFLLRKKGFAKRLVMSAKSGSARVHFTETKYENPNVPPMFCMLVRKHYSSARLVKVMGIGLERILEFCFETTNELGDRVNPKIICELIGNQSNIILIDNDGRIIDAVRRSDIETSARMVQPGAVYEYPPSQGKLNLLETPLEEIEKRCFSCGDVPVSKAILSSVDGISPLLAREIAYRAFFDDILVSEIEEKEKLGTVMCDIISDIKEKINPVSILRDGTPADFSYTDITQYGSSVTLKKFLSFSELLDDYYSERELKSRINRAASDIIKTVSNARTRAVKRLALRQKELSDCKDREQLRIYGELIKANLYMIESGCKSVVVQNYYDPELKTIEIPLNPALSPSANAAKYFKDYKKSYTAEQTLTELTEKDSEEIVYLDSVLESIERCKSLGDISDIREELIDGGYIRKNSREKRKKPVEGADIREFYTKEGYRVLVGKNNRQNDYITTRLAAKNDTWFHTKNIPGSHLVVLNGGNPISEETVVSAASVAAFYSKASSSSQVPVDYTEIKYVKKPNGAKFGMVIYTTNRTVFVTPNENALEKGEKGV